MNNDINNNMVVEALKELFEQDGYCLVDGHYVKSIEDLMFWSNEISVKKVAEKPISLDEIKKVLLETYKIDLDKLEKDSSELGWTKYPDAGY